MSVKEGRGSGDREGSEGRESNNGGKERKRREIEEEAEGRRRLFRAN